MKHGCSGNCTPEKGGKFSSSIESKTSVDGASSRPEASDRGGSRGAMTPPPPAAKRFTSASGPGFGGRGGGAGVETKVGVGAAVLVGTDMETLGWDEPGSDSVEPDSNSPNTSKIASQMMPCSSVPFKGNGLMC